MDNNKMDNNKDKKDSSNKIIKILIILIVVIIVGLSIVVVVAWNNTKEMAEKTGWTEASVTESSKPEESAKPTSTSGSADSNDNDDNDENSNEEQIDPNSVSADGQVVQNSETSKQVSDNNHGLLDVQINDQDTQSFVQGGDGSTAPQQQKDYGAYISNIGVRQQGTGTAQMTEGEVDFYTSDYGGDNSKAISAAYQYGYSTENAFIVDYITLTYPNGAQQYTGYKVIRQ